MAVRRWFGIAALLVGSLAAAQEPTAVVPGPFRSYVVYDGRTKATDARNRKNKMHDLVTENGLNPVLAVFRRTDPKKPDIPTNLIGRVNAMVTQRNRDGGYKEDRLGAFAVFLTLTKEYPEDEQRAEKATEVEKLATQLNPTGMAVGVAAGAGEGAKKFDLKEGHDLTVVFYNRMKVIKTWTFTPEKPITPEDIKAIESTVAAELKK